MTTYSEVFAEMQSVLPAGIKTLINLSYSMAEPEMTIYKQELITLPRDTATQRLMPEGGTEMTVSIFGQDIQNQVAQLTSTPVAMLAMTISTSRAIKLEPEAPQVSMQMAE